MKIVFMGTPDFAVPSLHALTEAGYAVAAVVTQPDKPKGRGKTLLPTPVKEEAVMHDIPVYQPEKVRNNPEFLEILKEINPDIIVVAAYGQIIPKEILELPKFGCINIHASLLPKYRGAAPIQQAVIDGEKVSGVTIQQMGEGLDTGDMISKIVIPISPTETGGSLFGKLAQAGADLLIKTLPSIEQGTAEFEKQPEESPTPYAAMITKQMGLMDFRKSAEELERLVRGLIVRAAVAALIALVGTQLDTQNFPHVLLCDMTFFPQFTQSLRKFYHKISPEPLDTRVLHVYYEYVQFACLGGVF